MTGTSDDDRAAAIRDLARDCAAKGLRLRHARALFDQLYCADAVVQEQGNVTRAAERAGIARPAFWRMTTKGSGAPEVRPADG